MFFVIVFSFRFVIELVKEHQSELLMNSAIDMGSVLSIPFIIAGVVLILQANRKIKNTSNKIS